MGKALEAFKMFPDGFVKYKGKSEKLSLDINKFLSKNGLRPTPDYSLYSFRHSFQDRLTAQEVPDRIQCQLMGHSFKSKGRVRYGEGGSLEHLKGVVIRLTTL